MEGGQPLFSRAGEHVTLSAGGSVVTGPYPRSWGCVGTKNSVALLGESRMAGVYCWELEIEAGIAGVFFFGVCKAGVDVTNTEELYYGSDAWFMDAYCGVLSGTSLCV